MDEQTNPQPTSGNQPQPTDDEADLRELAVALLASRYPYAAEGEPELLLGVLPPDFPGDIPVLPGSRILGSLVAERPIAVLDTDQADEAVIAFYEERLPALGWIKPEPSEPERHGGFIESGHGIVSKVPRQGTALYRNDGPSLQISAYRTQSGHTRIQLMLNPHGAREFRHNRRSMGHRDEMFSMLPPIEPPPNAQQSGGGGSFGGDHIEVEGSIESDLDLSALAIHYAAQLEKGGWQRTGGEANGPVAWSTWTFEDEEKEPWRALFVILNRPDAPKKSWLRIVADWTGDRSQGGPHATSSGPIGWQEHHQSEP